MKNVLVMSLSVVVLFLGNACQKASVEEEKELLERKNEMSHICNSNSDASLIFYLPTTEDTESIETILSPILSHLIAGENYLEIDRDDAAGEIRFAVKNFSDAFPYDKPIAEKTLYEGTDKEIAALTGVLAQMNYECLPVVCFQYDGVFVVEDCC